MHKFIFWNLRVVVLVQLLEYCGNVIITWGSDVHLNCNLLENSAQLFLVELAWPIVVNCLKGKVSYNVNFVFHVEDFLETLKKTAHPVEFVSLVFHFINYTD